MELIDNLALGFATALTLQNLFYCFIGVLIGTLIGVLPGIGPVATLAMLLPVTYALPPTSALIMLAGIYYGAQYGGSTTAISGQPPWRIVVGCDLHRRLSDGSARSSWGRAWRLPRWGRSSPAPSASSSLRLWRCQWSSWRSNSGPQNISR